MNEIRIVRIIPKILPPGKAKRDLGQMEIGKEYVLKIPPKYTRLQAREGTFQIWSAIYEELPVLLYNFYTEQWELKDKRRKNEF